MEHLFVSSPHQSQVNMIWIADPVVLRYGVVANIAHSQSYGTTIAFIILKFQVTFFVLLLSLLWGRSQPSPSPSSSTGLHRASLSHTNRLFDHRGATHTNVLFARLRLSSMGHSHEENRSGGGIENFGVGVANSQTVYNFVHSLHIEIE